MKTKKFIAIGFVFIFPYFGLAQQICDQYPQIKDNFTIEKDFYHGYTVETYICNADSFKSATKDLIYSIFLSKTSFVAPTYNTAQVLNCGKVICNLGAVSVDLKYFIDDKLTDDPIVTVIDKSKYKVTNFTLPEHRLHDGKVMRMIVQRGKDFYIVTVGTGNNSSKFWYEVNSNLEFMNLLWHRIDAMFVAEVRKKLGADVPIITVTPLKPTFSIAASMVTLPNDKAFKWYEWDKAPDDLKVAAGYLNMYTNRNTGKLATLLEYIQVRIKEGCTVKIAAIDLDNDGVCGLIVNTAGMYCCGTAGCGFEVYDNGGLKTVNVDVTRDDLVPAKNGITLNRQLFPLIFNNQIQVDSKKITALFTYDVVKAKDVKAIDLQSFVGGKTPEELGKVLLRALKTNDKNLWIHCLHPDLETIYPGGGRTQAISESFDRVRNGLIRYGLTDWSLAQFSRVTYDTYDNGLHAVDFKLEFTYKNGEFVAGVAIPSTIQFKGKYYLITTVEDFGMVRNVHR